MCIEPVQISTRCHLLSRLVNRTHHAHTRSLLTSSAATHLRTQQTKQHSVCTVSTHLSSPICPTPRDVDGTLSGGKRFLSLENAAAADICIAMAQRCLPRRDVEIEIVSEMNRLGRSVYGRYPPFYRL